MNTPVTFKPAGSVTIMTPAGSLARPFDRPPVDPENPDVQISNRSPHPVWLAFGDGAQARPDSAGTVTVKAGQHALISANDVALNMRLVDVHLPQGSYTPRTWVVSHAEAVAAAEKVSVLTHSAGCEVVITRGIAGASTQF